MTTRLSPFLFCALSAPGLSPGDGRKPVFASNCNGKPHETNLFIADWNE